MHFGVVAVDGRGNVGLCSCGCLCSPIHSRMKRVSSRCSLYTCLFSVSLVCAGVCVEMCVAWLSLSMTKRACLGLPRRSSGMLYHADDVPHPTSQRERGERGKQKTRTHARNERACTEDHRRRHNAETQTKQTPIRKGKRSERQPPKPQEERKKRGRGVSVAHSGACGVSCRPVGDVCRGV